MKKWLITDLDNTVFEFSSHFEDWAVARGYDIRLGALGKETYYFQDVFGPDENIDQIVDEFFSCEKTFRSYGPLRRCVGPVQRLKLAGWDFVGITACNPQPWMEEARSDNFANIFGFALDAIHVTGFVGTKKQALELYEPSIWVEDNLEFALLGAELGHKVFLIDHPYNQGEGNFTRVHDWDEIEEALCPVS